MDKSMKKYTSTLPKDIIEYLSGYTGPDELHQLKYWERVPHDKISGKTIYKSYYSLPIFATSLKVKKGICKLIRSMKPKKWRKKFPFLLKSFSIKKSITCYRPSIQKPIKSIIINNQRYLAFPMKKKVGKRVFKSVTEFKKRYFAK